MLITKIKRNKLNYDVYIDEEFAFTLTDEGLYKARLKTGTELERTESLNEILRADEVKRCKNRALKIITDSPKSVNKVKEKLAREGFFEDAIEGAIAFLKDYKFVNDERLAQNITKRAVRANSSRRQIRGSLYQKGIQKEDIQKAIEEVDEEQEIENAKNIAIKKYNSIKSKSNEEIIKKVHYTLNYKGFSYRAIEKAMKNVKDILKDRETDFD